MAKTFVDDTVAKNSVVIFSKSRCHPCKNAKKTFDDLGVSYLAVELDNRSDSDDIQAVLGKMTGSSSLPRVFVMRQCIGGVPGSEDEDTLKTLLISCGLLKE